MSEWVEATVGDMVDRGVLDRPLDGNHGAIHPKGTDFVSRGIPFVMASDLENGRVDTHNCKFITRAQAESLRKGFSREGDVLLSHKATIGRTAIVGAIATDFIMLTPQVTYYRVRNHDQLNNRYLKYYFDSPPFQHVFAAWAGAGSTRAYLGITGQLKLPIRFPSIDEQRAIAGVLGALDDKIEQNRRTARVLERLARAIFRAWFVDFEPVKAKAAGATSFPSMPPDIFDTLPTTFQDSELGPIPDGWAVRTIADVCDVNARSVKKGEIEGVIQYVDISSVTKGELHETSDVDFADAPSRARRRVQNGDTIWSCVRPNRMSYLYIADPLPNKIVSTGFAVISPRTVGQSFVYQLTTQPEFVGYLVANATGSAYPAVRADHFERAEFCCPRHDVMEAFEVMARPMRDWIAAAARESRKLAELRDYLLPLLLSGKVKV